MDETPQAARHVCSVLNNAGHRALFAGGCVRDMLLGVTPEDYDIATSATPEEVGELFEQTHSVGAAFGVQVVLLPEGRFEVATFRKDGPYLDGRHPATVEFLDEREDALRRDFTINALFFDPTTNEVVDFVDGKADLENGVIRCVGDPERRFEEDHLRLLRAIRFAARFDYSIDDLTFKALCTNAAKIHKTSPERVRDELVKMLTGGGARRAFELMDETGLLSEVLPEISAMKGVEQPPQFHPEGDVFTHTLLMLDALESPSVQLAFATLLHDVGKPLTQTRTDRIRFNHHDKVGARQTENICRRLHMSNDDVEGIAWMVEQHMRVAATPEMRESKRKRLVRSPGFQELLQLFRIDCLCSHGKMDVFEWLNEYASNLKPDEAHPDALLSGHDIIEMGYTPGPLFSEILESVEDEQLEGRLTHREDAKLYVRERWPSPPSEGGKSR